VSTQTVVSGKKSLFERVCDTQLFQNLFALGLIGGGILTLLAGLVGLVVWVAPFHIWVLELALSHATINQIDHQGHLNGFFS
jgi:hypothetical protein